jgi:hypothetical protein
VAHSEQLESAVTPEDAPFSDLPVLQKMGESLFAAIRAAERDELPSDDAALDASAAPAPPLPDD